MPLSRSSFKRETQNEKMKAIRWSNVLHARRTPARFDDEGLYEARLPSLKILLWPSRSIKSVGGKICVLRWSEHPYCAFESSHVSATLGEIGVSGHMPYLMARRVRFPCHLQAAF